MSFLLNKNARLLVVVAHADDEILGAGGMLSMAARAGARTRVLILSTSSSSRDVDDAQKDSLRLKRITAAENVAKLLGFTVSFRDFQDNSFDSISALQITKEVEKELREFIPTAIVTHFPGDVSRDHQIVSSAVITAARPSGNGRPAPAIVFFEVNSSTNWNFGVPHQAFSPNMWIPLDEDTLNQKIRAIEEYADELREWPHPRSREGVSVLAKYRGAEVGMDMCEAFIIARYVDVQVNGDAQ